MMSRVSIVILLFVALGTSVVGTKLLVFPRVFAVVEDEVRDGMQTAFRLIEQMDRAGVAKLISRTSESARRPKLLELLGNKPAPSGATEQWLNDLRVEIAGMTASVRNFATVSDMFILNTDGMGLVRNIDMHWTGKSPSDNNAVLNIVEKACHGEARAVLVNTEHVVSRVVAVPVSDKGRLLGVLLGIFPLDATEMRARKSFVESDMDIAVIVGGEVKASSLEKTKLSKVERYLADHRELVEKMISAGDSHPEIMEIRSLGAFVLGASLKSIDEKTSAPCGLLLLRWTSSMVHPMHEIALYLFVGTGLLFVFLSFLVILLGGGLTRSLKGLESDLLDVVNSGKNHVVRAKGPAVVKSIANLCSQLASKQASEDDDEFVHKQSWADLDDMNGSDDDSVSNKSGEDKGEQGDGEQEFKQQSTQDDTSDKDGGADDIDGIFGSQDDVNVESNSGDPLLEYYASLFSEFCSAKEDIGEHVDRLSLSRFRARLEKQSKKIKARHSCKDVRFVVMIKAGKVSLQPRIVR